MQKQNHKAKSVCWAKFALVRFGLGAISEQNRSRWNGDEIIRKLAAAPHRYSGNVTRTAHFAVARNSSSWVNHCSVIQVSSLLTIQAWHLTHNKVFHPISFAGGTTQRPFNFTIWLLFPFLTTIPSSLSPPSTVLLLSFHVLTNRWGAR